MNVPALLRELRELGIELRAKGDQLVVEGKKSALTAAIQERLRMAKPELMAFLGRIRSDDTLSFPPVETVSRRQRLPLSFAQLRLWFLERLEPGGNAYNLPAAWQLEGSIDRDCLDRVITEITRRHEVLRTHFDSENGQPYAVVEEPFSIEIPFEDLTGVPDSDRLEFLHRRFREEAAGAFDLKVAPLFRIRLFRFGPDDHYLLFVPHHIVWDAWSFDLLLKEVAALYDAFASDSPSPLFDPPVQYVDYAAWEADVLQGEACKQQLEYWRKSLAPPLPKLQLPTDRPRPHVLSYRGTSIVIDIPFDLMKGLEGLAREQGATIYSALLAAFSALLSRYTDQKEFCIGCPVENTMRPELDDLIGFFVNTLVLRLPVEPQWSFREAVNAAHDVCIDAFTNQHVPFEQVVAELDPERDRSRTPLTQVLLLYQNADTRPTEFGGMRMTQHAVPMGGAQTDMFLGFKSSPTGWALGVDYSTDLFDQETIERLLANFLLLIEEASARPDAPIESLEVISTAEREELLLRKSQETSGLALPELRIDQLIARQAELAPDAPAVAFEAVSLNRKELEVRANQLAQHLRANGVEAGSFVGVCIERSEAIPVVLLAVLRSGAAYLPIDPDYPEDRISFMLADSGASLVVTDAASSARLPADLATVDLARDRAAIEAHPVNAPELAETDQALAYLMYTSGSTGRPKGVMVEHRNVTSFLAGMQERVGFEAGDMWLTSTSISFDISVLEIFGPLVHGLPLVVYGDAAGGGRHGIGYSIAELIDRHAVTHYQCTPSQARLLLAEPESCRALASLRCLLLGGEALPLSLVQNLREFYSKRLLNMYGPTETTIWSAVHEVQSHGQEVSIGRPIANTRVYVLDQERRPVPIGVVGELAIAGAGVVRGYWDRPELTASRFVADPFDSAPGSRMYLTGDLVRFRNNGDLEFIGRNDHQVKIRGYRIELGEIESALGSVEGVASAAVIVREDSSGDQRLVAFWAAEQGVEVAPHAMREQLKESLPAYMIPSAFTKLDQLPLTPNGKIDRKALLPLAEHLGQAEYVAPKQLQRIPDAERVSCSSWKACESSPSAYPAGTTLIFMDAAGVGDRIATALQSSGSDVVRVHAGDFFAVIDRSSYSIAAENGLGDYRRLLQSLDEQGRCPTRIIHLWLITVDLSFRPGSKFFDRNLEHGFYSLTYLIQALAGTSRPDAIQIEVFGNGLLDSRQGVLQAEKATALGVCRVIPSEFGDLRTSCIDVSAFVSVDGAYQDLDGLARAAAGLPSSDDSCLQLSLTRDGQIEELCATPVSEDETELSLTGDDVVVISGALSGVGIAIAEALAEHSPARLVLVDQIPLEQDSELAGRIAAIGAQVEHLEYQMLDILDSDRLNTALVDFSERLGLITGLVHCVGVNRYSPMTQISRLDAAADLASYLHGTNSILSAASLVRAKWVLCCSSAHVASAPPGSAIASAGSAFMQACAEVAKVGSIRVSAIEWGVWNDEDWPEAVQQDFADVGSRSASTNDYAWVHAKGLRPAEAGELALRVLRQPGTSGVRVCALDIDAQTKQWARRSGTIKSYVAPRDELEIALAEIWSRVLGVEGVGVNDDFFDLGGHSLLAVRVYDEIRSRFGFEWPLATLFESSTVEAVADKIRSNRGAKDSAESSLRYLVRFAAARSSDKAPLFVAAGALGNCLNLRDLSSMIERERACYGLQARGLVGEEQPHSSFRDAATDYLREIKTVQPEGPYYLAGFCSGGLIAYEMARQLREKGEEVGLLVLLDTTLPSGLGELSMFERMVIQWQNLKQRGAKYLGEFVANRLRWEWRRWLGKSSQSEASTPEFRSQAIWDATMAAMESCKLERLDVPALLFRPRLEKAHQLPSGRWVDKGRLFVDEDNGWRQWLPALAVEELPGPAGDHDGFVLQPVVHNLARRLGHALRVAEQAAQPANDSEPNSADESVIAGATQ